MDRRARELLEKAETAQAEMMDYLRSNASRLGKRILIYGDYKPLPSIFTHFYLNPDGEIDEKSKRHLNDKYEVTREGRPLDNFVEEHGLRALRSAVKELGKELYNQQPLLPFEY